jgi:glycosyltransferase involved in cell wall biosynthesis
VGGIPEVLAEGENGWLVQPNDANALAQAIGECMGNPMLRQQKSASGKLFVEKFGKNEMLEHFINILQYATRSFAKG